MDRALAVPRLGVGIGYQPQLRPFLERHKGAFDFLEVVPDVVWNDRGAGKRPRYVPDPEATAFLAAVAAEKPVLPHGIGLSLGSDDRFEREHVTQMARWHEWLPFPWHSEQLGFQLEGDEGRADLNLTLPLPLDRDTLGLVAARAREIQRRIPAPFLLQNHVGYFRYAQEELDEPTFLNELTRRSGCGLLLDLHKLHVNARNRGSEPRAFLERLDLETVIEIHVAGGMEFQGVYVDAHSGAVPDAVWELLDWVLPRCPRLGGLAFELFGGWFEPLGEDGLLRELEHLRELWRRYLPPPGTRPA